MKAGLENRDEARTRSTAFWVAAAAVVFGAVLIVCSVYFTAFIIGEGNGWGPLIKDHFPAIIGLPLAAALAFVLVVFLRQVDGPIEFEGLGFKFKGASGQVAMWIAAFLAIAGAIKLCW